MENPVFCVIIVNYNAGSLLQQALDSVLHQSLAAAEIIIVDNDSSDGSIETLRVPSDGCVKILRSNANLGFAGGNNLAARQTQCDWLALLNPDAIADPDWLETLAVAISGFPTVDMFASAQIDADDPETLDGAGDCYFAGGIPWRGGFGLPISELPLRGECFSACGASLLIRRSRFEELGGFDEDFFCYCEDVDLGFRHRLAGGHCIFLPEARVAHVGSATSGRHSDFTIRLGTRNRIWTYVTNMPPIGLFLTFPLQIALTTYLCLRAAGRPYARAMCRGVCESVAGIGIAWRKRRFVAATRSVGTFGVLRSMCLDPRKLASRKPHTWPVSEALARRDGPVSALKKSPPS